MRATQRVKCLILLLCLAVFLSNPVLAEPAPNASKPPNLILMLADDLGYGDLGVTGSKQIPTPRIDSLAAGGVCFTNAYVSSSVCAPSRAGLMTGKHQAAFGFRDNLAPVQPGHDPEYVGLPQNQTTLAEQLKKLGYTTALVGKWHLGELPKFSPLQQGFDVFWGYLGGAHDYFRAEPEDDKTSGKTTVLEGGIRVPMIFKWPALLPSGATIGAMVSSLDIFPTFVCAAGGAVGKSDRLTGVDLLPLLYPSGIRFRRVVQVFIGL